MWKYIDEYTSLPETNTIHCDTRDFYIKCENFTQEYLHRIFKGIRHSNVDLTDCKFKPSEILKTLKQLEERSGGKGNWRHLTLESRLGWLKYIRFIKTHEVIDEEPVYIAYTTSNDNVEVLSHKLLSEPINKEYLNYI